MTSSKNKNRALEVSKRYMTKEQLEILEKIPQFPVIEGEDREELIIGKNDPKSGATDYWWCRYGTISLSDYYSLPKLLADLADECLKHGYAELPENSLLE